MRVRGAAISMALGVLLATSPVHTASAFTVVTTNIAGFGAPLGSAVGFRGDSTYPLNDFGVVLLNGGLVSGLQGDTLWLANGRTFSLVGGGGPGMLAPDGHALNNSNVITQQRGPIYQGLPQYYQLFDLAPPYTSPGVFNEASAPYASYTNRTDTNSAGQGVAVLEGAFSPTRQSQLVRLNGDGTTTALTVPSNYLNTSQSRVRILDNGDIYVGVNNSSTQRFEVWKFAPGDPVNHTVAYATGSASVALGSWAVGEDGRLAVAENSGPQREWLVKVVRPGGTEELVQGSSTPSPGSIGDVFLDGMNRVAFLRNSASGTDLFYAENGQAAVRVLGTGDLLNGGRILSMRTQSDMNAFGQVTLGIQLDFSPQSNPIRSVLVRVDPPGSDPRNPVVPDVCALGGGWCFDIDAPRRVAARPMYFDPDLATGYEYLASQNAFAGVEIPYAYGDGMFDLFLWDAVSGAYRDSGFDVLTGIYFDFLEQLGVSGLQRFALYGIEAPVDASDPLGFVTGLTFSQEGSARFSMIPILREGNGSGSVPEPSSLLLIGLALGVLARKRGTVWRRA